MRAFCPHRMTGGRPVDHRGFAVSQANPAPRRYGPAGQRDLRAGCPVAGRGQPTMGRSWPLTWRAACRPSARVLGPQCDSCECSTRTLMTSGPCGSGTGRSTALGAVPWGAPGDPRQRQCCARSCRAPGCAWAGRANPANRRRDRHRLLDMAAGPVMAVPLMSSECDVQI